MKPVVFFQVICAVALLAGCAVNPQHYNSFSQADFGALAKNTKGEPVVFVQQKYTQNDRYRTPIEVLPPMAVGVFAAIVAVDVAATHAPSQTVTVRFRAYEGGPPLSDDDRRLSRPLWPDFNRLRQDAWAVVRLDPDGQPYLAPCLADEGCDIGASPSSPKKTEGAARRLDTGADRERLGLGNDQVVTIGKETVGGHLVSVGGGQLAGMAQGAAGGMGVPVVTGPSADMAQVQPGRLARGPSPV